MLGLAFWGLLYGVECLRFLLEASGFRVLVRVCVLRI